MKFDNTVKKDALNAEDKINLLLTEGYSLPCDETSTDLVEVDELPDWYDEAKFKRGQKFFHHNIFMMFFAKLCGLMTLLLVPTVLNILKFTNMSSKPLTVYKRYMSTILHMVVWYNKDFKPGSDLWKSITVVRNKHFSASRRARKGDLKYISQADMAITQFGFMGYVITHPHVVGIYHASREDLEGFIHLWRVVGHLLGIEDRFNLCSGSVEETKECCQLIIKKVFHPLLKDPPKDFKPMSQVLIDGMTVFQPLLHYGVFLTNIFRMCDVSFEENNNISTFFEIDESYKWHMVFFKNNVYLYRFTWFRILQNITQYFGLFLIKYFPFLAFYKYGFKNSYLPPLFKDTATDSL